MVINKACSLLTTLVPHSSVAKSYTVINVFFNTMGRLNPLTLKFLLHYQKLKKVRPASNLRTLLLLNTQTKLI